MGFGKVVVFVVVLVAVWAGTTTNGLSMCNIQQKDLQACGPAVDPDSPTKPSPQCCEVVKGLTQNQVQCLCDYKNNEPSMLSFAGVDPTRAMELPGLCNGSSDQFNCS